MSIRDVDMWLASETDGIRSLIITSWWFHAVSHSSSLCEFCLYMCWLTITVDLLVWTCISSAGVDVVGNSALQWNSLIKILSNVLKCREHSTRVRGQNISLVQYKKKKSQIVNAKSHCDRKTKQLVLIDSSSFGIYGSLHKPIIQQLIKSQYISTCSMLLNDIRALSWTQTDPK